MISVHTDNFPLEALKALLEYAPDVEFVATRGLYGYNKAIASRWDGSDDLVVIEQDKEITAEVLPSFEKCDHRWCAYSYPVFPKPYTKIVSVGLGCTKYSAEAQRLVSVDQFICGDPEGFPVCKLCGGKGCWRHLDSRIAKALINAGVQTHVHGQIKHHHDYGDDAEEWRLKELYGIGFGGKLWIVPGLVIWNESWFTKMLISRVLEQDFIGLTLLFRLEKLWLARVR